MSWGTTNEREIRRRIVLSVATYAYEIADRPIMPDLMWDHMAQSIDPSMGTGHPLIDEFFATHFSPMTGMWIHHHPELSKVKNIFDQYYATMRDHFDAISSKTRELGRGYNYGRSSAAHPTGQ